MSQILISNLHYATFANYSPRGSSELSKKSRDICYKFKNGNESIRNSLIKELMAILAESEIYSEFLGPAVTLVPCPRSSLLVTGGLWPAKLIADDLFANGLVKEVMPCLERMIAVPKSATAAAGHRPTVKTHYESLKVINVEIFKPSKITIIDDVLTKGNTVFACAMRLREAFPDAEVRVFTPMRTQGLIAEISKIKDPSLGEITLNGVEAVREP